LKYADINVFCDPIERFTGRKVRAFVSGIDVEADVASEMFVLHPWDTKVHPERLPSSG
jgi:hypothetical protein